ncbi:MAG: CHC2 zinc finger domain-containing protein, partial [Bacteroidales bacterium]
MINEQTIEKIHSQTDIAAVIGQFVKLSRKGTSYRGLCPFHEERNPSFSVSPAKGIYKCFSCGEAGDAIAFLMRHEAMNFEEAARWLANKYGIAVEASAGSDAQRRRQSERERFLHIQQLAL